MNDELSRLRDAPAPPVDEVRRRVLRRRIRRRIARGTALAATLGAVFLLIAPGTRDRGLGDRPLVSLDAVAEGPRGARPLADGAEVAVDERVVFFVRTSAEGTATLRELDTPIGAPWSVRAGDSVQGGEEPMSWRPDRPIDHARYELEVCSAPGRCGTDALVLRWAR